MAEEANIIQGPWQPPESSYDHPSLKSGGGDGTSGGMEARIKRLEEDVTEVKTDVKALRSEFADMRVTLARIEVQLAELPSRNFVFVTVFGIVGLVLAAIAVAPFLRMPVGG